MTYNLDALGWLQFERLCDQAFELCCGVDRTLWTGSADEERTAIVLDEAVDMPLGLGRARAPVALLAVWVMPGHRLLDRLNDLGIAGRGMIVLTNAAVDEAPPHLVIGRDRLGAMIDAEPRLRLRVPSVLGVRAAGDLDPQAHALARVFVPTRAYDRAVDLLEQHHFAVLTGPPEMGKTAIARMVALAQASAAWDVHDCHAPEDVMRVHDGDRPQVFIADDAFGSTEYRPDAAERWARELPQILRLTAERHWLIWTSRPAPLRAGLHRVHQERGTERFPSPAQVQVDAGDLDTDEKASILLRHAKAAGLDRDTRAWVRQHCERIVGHRHFTPERIRRLIARRTLRGDPAPVLHAELGTPTEAMAASLAALDDEHRDVLIAMLDTPMGPVGERELAASMRRHHRGGLPHAPRELIDRLADHFLRVHT
jgi:hypothetical protein